jgi:hypothetical protein
MDRKFFEHHSIAAAATIFATKPTQNSSLDTKIRTTTELMTSLMYFLEFYIFYKMKNILPCESSLRFCDFDLNTSCKCALICGYFSHLELWYTPRSST